MAQYIMTALTKESNGWAHLTTAEVSMVAQANPGQLRKDIMEHTKTYFVDDDEMDKGQIERSARSIQSAIEDIDVEDLIKHEVTTILYDLLDEDQVNIDDLDLGSFVDASIDVSTSRLEDEIEEHKSESELNYKLIFDAVGTMKYEVHDADNVLVGCVLITWLEG